MDAGAEFPGLTVETRTAAERFERDTGRWVADEIDERDEKMVRLFLILHGYHPGAEAPGDFDPFPGRTKVMSGYDHSTDYSGPEPGLPTVIAVVSALVIFMSVIAIWLWL